MLKKKLIAGGAKSFKMWQITSERVSNNKIAKKFYVVGAKRL